MTSKVKNSILLTLVAFHLSIYVSAIWTNHFQVFYPWGIIHQENYRYIDYYQIPSGAKSLSEQGNPAGSASPVVVNQNVYHPLTTAVFGFPLRFLTPEAGFIAYALFKLLATVMLGFVLYRKFRNHAGFMSAAFVFLCFFAQVVEIGIGQYHFPLMIATFALLLLPEQASFRIGLCYLLGLLIKPVGLLWTPYFLLNKKKITWLVATGTFLAITYYAYTEGWATLYVNNLLYRTTSPLDVTLMTPTLEGVLRTLGMSQVLWLTVKGAIAGMLLMFQFICKPRTLIGLLQWVSYSLLCYSLSYDYHYTMLVPFFVLGLLREPVFASRIVRWPILWSCLPSPYFLISHSQLFFTPDKAGHLIATPAGSLLVEGSRILPVIAVNLAIAWKMIKERELASDLHSMNSSENASTTQLSEGLESIRKGA